MWLIILFWVFFALAVHPYVTYPIMILFLSILRPRPVTTRTIYPRVSLVIAAFNEEGAIAKRIENCLALDYPEHALEIVIASDGSTDGTNDIVQEYAAKDPRVRLLDLEHAGQTASINAGVKAATGDIIVRTDAHTSFTSDVVRKLVMHFADERVYCVVGKVTMLPLDEDGPYKVSESLYWRFEGSLRSLEALAGVAFVGSGPCMAVRRDHYPILQENAVEDLTATMQIISKGGRILQVSDLGAYDYMDGHTQGQVRSRSRRVTAALSAIAGNRSILNPLRYPLYSFSIFSHKIIRWLLGFWLLGMLGASAVLGFWNDFALYRCLFYAQVVFYALAFLGILAGRTRFAIIPLLSVPMAICVVSAAFLKGIRGFIRGDQSARWEPARPADSHHSSISHSNN